MAEQRKGQGRVGTWPGPIGAAAPWLRPLPGLAGPMAARLREWAAAEVAPGRLMPWLPVGFGLGIVVYFSADREPIWWVAAILAGIAIAAAYRLRASSIGFPVAIGCAAVAAGLPPLHPGEMLREEFLEPFNLTPYACGVPRTRIERIVREELGITADTALRLAKVFGNSVEF